MLTTLSTCHLHQHVLITLSPPTQGVAHVSRRVAATTLRRAAARATGTPTSSSSLRLRIVITLTPSHQNFALHFAVATSSFHHHLIIALSSHRRHYPITQPCHFVSSRPPARHAWPSRGCAWSARRGEHGSRRCHRAVPTRRCRRRAVRRGCAATGTRPLARVVWVIIRVRADVHCGVACRRRAHGVLCHVPHATMHRPPFAFHAEGCWGFEIIA